MSPGIDSKESIGPAYVAWLSGTSNRVVVPDRQARNWFLGSLYGLQIRALACRHDNPMPELTLSPSQGSMNSVTVLIPAASQSIRWMLLRKLVQKTGSDAGNHKTKQNYKPVLSEPIKENVCMPRKNELNILMLSGRDILYIYLWHLWGIYVK